MGDQGVRGKDSGVFLARLPDVIKTDISVNRMWPFKVGFLTVLFFIFYRWESVSCREKKWSGCRGWLFPIKTSSPLPAHLILFISSSSFIPDFSGAWYLQHQPFLACPQSCPHSRLSFSFSSFFSFFFFPPSFLMSSHLLSSFQTGSFQTSVCWCCSSLVFWGVLWRHRDNHMFSAPCWTRSSEFL